MDERELAQEILRELSFDGSTGRLFRKSRPDKSIGRPNHRGHLTMTFAKKNLLVHRIVWLIHYGVWPRGDVDHINNNKTDNRICNLRIADRNTNMQNRVLAQANCKSGARGVTYRPERAPRPWVASISISGRKINLGQFESKENAAAAYWEAKHRLHDGYSTAIALAQIQPSVASKEE